MYIIGALTLVPNPQPLLALAQGGGEEGRGGGVTLHS